MQQKHDKLNDVANEVDYLLLISVRVTSREETDARARTGNAPDELDERYFHKEGTKREIKEKRMRNIHLRPI